MLKKSNLRLIISIFVACMVWTSQAQTQQGYVKTLGRPHQKGVALNGVSIRVRGGHNAVLSDAKGFFSMMMVGKKEGDAYALQQVQKQGYQLNDENMIGRRYAISSKVPLTIVMVSTKQLQADKQRIENNAYKTAEKNYQTQKALLEKRQQANQITIEIYRQEIQQLQNSFEKYQSLIDGLAEHYAHTDYDELEAKEREINLCIENGDLDKAEQLLQALDIEKRLAEIEQRIKAGQQLKEEALEDQRQIQKQQEKDAEYLYQLYTIALGRFDNKKARYYIETRAALDSTNVRWQIDAGEFLFEYLNLFDQAKSYFLNAESHADKESLEMAECWNDIGTVNLVRGKFQTALQYFQQSLQLRQQLVPENSPQMATIYNSFATTYLALGRTDEALEYHRNSLAIRRMVYGEVSAKVALTYYNIGAVLIAKKDFDGAKTLFAKGLDIAEQLKGNMPVVLLLKLYDGMGAAIGEKADAEGKPHPSEVKMYREKALDLCLRIYGEKNIHTAGIYHNLGTEYAYEDIRQVTDNDTLSTYDITNSQKGLEYLVKSLAIKKELAPHNLRPIKETENIIRSIAKVYYIFGIRNYEKHNIKQMIFYFKKCQDVFKIASDPEDADIIKTVTSVLSQLNNKQ